MTAHSKSRHVDSTLAERHGFAGPQSARGLGGPLWAPHVNYTIT
jgi:hypothetical protein